MIDQYEYIIAKEKPDSGGITIEFLNTFGAEGWEAIYFNWKRSQHQSSLNARKNVTLNKYHKRFCPFQNNNDTQ